MVQRLQQAIGTVRQRVHVAEHNAALAAKSTLNDSELEEEDDGNDGDEGSLADDDHDDPKTAWERAQAGPQAAHAKPLTKKHITRIAKHASLPGEGPMNLNKYFAALEKDDGHDHTGRADGVRIQNSLPHPSCIDSCRLINPTLALTLTLTLLY